MRTVFICATLLIFISCLFSSCKPSATEEAIKSDGGQKADMIMITEQDLRSANEQFYAALNAMFMGDLEPMNAIWSHGDNITDMGPFGGRLTGWEEVGAEFTKEAGMKLGGKVVCKDLHVYPGTEMGYTVCVEEGENMSADGKQVTVHHRATNIFQLENGKWKMVHHQTDLSPQLEAATSSEK